MTKRIITASKDIATQMKLLKQKKVIIYSFFPVDKADCVCHIMIDQWKKKIALMPPQQKDAEIHRLGNLVCPRDKTFMHRYEIYCTNCGAIQGYCWATDATLKDWCDFHYTSWTDGKQWFGCFTPHVSPIDESLCLECTCGNDTRDFRANMTLPTKMSTMLEESNKIGRDFGKKDSKFKVNQISSLAIVPEDRIVTFIKV